MTTARFLGSNDMQTLAALLLTLAASNAQIAVRYVLAEHVLLVDPAPDHRFDTQSTMRNEFRARFDTTFPGQVIELGPGRMISPDERVIVILARITSARTAHTVLAGTVHSYDA